MKWSGILHTYFCERGYYFIPALHGGKNNGYMGVGIAVPLDKFSIEEVNVTRIVDTKKMPRKQPRNKWWEKLVDLLLKWWLALLLYMKWAKKAEDAFWDDALYRWNMMVCVRLQFKDSKKTFVVGTYHMPCMFKLPRVMVAHCALSAQHIQRFAHSEGRQDPFIYCGDFNIKPDSSMYRLLTEGTLEPSHPDYPIPVEGDDWRPEVQPPLLSAYKVANGSEPDFTNFAQTVGQPIFCETLDYIFHSNEWCVDSVLELPHRNNVAGPLPNRSEPSDHLLLAATLSLP